MDLNSFLGGGATATVLIGGLVWLAKSMIAEAIRSLAAEDLERVRAAQAKDLQAFRQAFEKEQAREAGELRRAIDSQLAHLQSSLTVDREQRLVRYRLAQDRRSQAAVDVYSAAIGVRDALVDFAVASETGGHSKRERHAVVFLTAVETLQRSHSAALLLLSDEFEAAVRPYLDVIGSVMSETGAGRWDTLELRATDMRRVLPALRNYLTKEVGIDRE